MTPLRLAVATPLPPSTSGIADYAVDLVAGLVAAGATVTAYSEPAALAPAAWGGTVPCQDLAQLGPALDRGAVDLAVYQLGNSADHHEGIYRLALERPGVVVLHEYMLHHLVRELTLARGDAAGYLEEMRYAAGATGWRAARRLLDSHYPVDVWSFPLFERLVDRSLGVIVHSEFARRRILASRPATPVEVAPFPLDLDALRPPTAAERARARAAIGVGSEELLVATFGFVTPQKHLEPALAAFARLRAERPGARFAVVGEISPYYDFLELLRRTGDAGVHVSGRVPLEQLHDWMIGCDLAINLRHPTGGETSATLLRLLALGRPTLVTDAGSFAELSDGAVARVAVGADEEAQILALLRRLADDRELATALGAAGRREVERRHGLAAAAGAYLDFCVRVRRDISPPETPVPPLAPHRPDDPRVGLASALGAALADLGVGEGDPALAGVASALVELGLDPGAD